MIPIRDTTPSRNVPVVNNLLIGVNVLVFLLELAQGPGMDRFIFYFGLVPARFSLPSWATGVTPDHLALTLLTFMFLHGGFLHLLGNMWVLYIFGDNVEDRLGPLRYLAFYLVCGLASGLTHMFLNAHSTAPTIGASGAIAGVMGAYFLLHPTSRILTLIPIIIIPWFVEIPAYFFLGLWFLLQLVNASAGSASGGIAWWAHIGGFVFGMLSLKLFDAVPQAGLTTRLRRATAKRRTNRLQVARPDEAGPADDLHATISISPFEALVGARKLVSVPFGFQHRVFRVDVPPGVSEGKTLRLRGQGRQRPDGIRGDLLLKVVIQ